MAYQDPKDSDTMILVKFIGNDALIIKTPIVCAKDILKPFDISMQLGLVTRKQISINIFAISNLQ